MTKILMSNLGYLRGIDGRLASHVFYAHRHIYASAAAQRKSLAQLQEIIAKEEPDICCLVEIDKGSHNSAQFNQLEALTGERYPFRDIENKYGEQSPLRRFAWTKGKCNAFLAKQEISAERLYFKHGVKRLIYKLHLPGDMMLYFAHFSLKKKVRARQLLEARQLLDRAPRASIFMGDFNILEGVGELNPLLQGENYVLLNDTAIPTFTFHRSRKLLDLCICPRELTAHMRLRVIAQSFSDHAALLLEITR